MATKTISLEIDAYEKLRRAKRTGESFSAVVRRAHFGPADATGASIVAALDRISATPGDRDAAEWWEQGPERRLRSVSPSHWTDAPAS